MRAGHGCYKFSYDRGSTRSRFSEVVAEGMCHPPIIAYSHAANFSLQVMVATNVAARGLDIPEVDLVVMCHPPDSVETYIHRSGRTGRAGRSGTCVVFYTPKEAGDLQHISVSVLYSK